KERRYAYKRFAPNNFGSPASCRRLVVRRGIQLVRRGNPIACADGTVPRHNRKLRTKCEEDGFRLLPPWPRHAAPSRPRPGCRLLLAGDLADELGDFLRLFALNDLGRHRALSEAVLRVAGGGRLLEAAVVDRA